jgi:NAD(P)H dehydrogenase (quinone)
MSVAVTGASGQLGRRVAELLLDRLEPQEVVLVTRRPEALADLAARGADVRHGDFDDPAGLTAALAGVERLLLISADVVGKRVEQHRAAIQAARAAGVRHVAYTSCPDPREGNPAFVAADHRATEQVLRDSGLEWTILRHNMYADYQVPAVAQAIAAGRLVTNAGNGATAYVWRDDCAAADAAVLAGAGHEGRIYDITGPEPVDADKLAAIASELSGADVEVVRVDDDAWVAGLVAAGTPEDVARGLATLGAAARDGWLEAPSTAVEELTGRPPRSLRDLVAEQRALVASST